MNKEKKQMLTWVFVIPLTGIILSTAYYIELNVSSFLTTDYIILLLLAILVGLFPIKTENSILFLINGISLPVLVIFGLVPEILVSSIALVILMIRSNLRIDQHYRYAVNLLMFYFLSVFSAVFYYFTVSITNSIFDRPFIFLALVIYFTAHFTLNQIGVYLINRYCYDQKNNCVFEENSVFFLFINLLISPLSFLLIYLYEIAGTIGILIGAFPFLTLTIGINVYYKVKMHNKYLKQMNRFSQKLNAKKSRENVLNMFIHALIEIFPTDALSYFTIDGQDRVLREKVIVKKKSVKTNQEEFHLAEQSILKQAIVNDRILYHSQAKDWKAYCENDLSYNAESALVMPVKVLDNIQGVILMTHNTRSIYDEMLVSLIEVFHKYFIIAMDNAMYYDQLEQSAEKDYLTALPNLKGLSKQLQLLKQKDCLDSLSLIVLDLDFFKNINDTHGHQSGNEILKELGKRLRANLPEDIYIARFGGEEFIVLLPNFSQETALKIAEEIRQLIADTPFSVSESMQTNTKQEVTVTASLGVATSTHQGADIEELIHLADRAMYIGSKQQGRNRVTVAQKGS
ncbi:GGDEF domain-containing protein [Alkalibacterium kapii]|uniref:GGDEF domain-containing protein n=1 Tax=Alkalibacterium kapii TaxID=426704 RepID=A0A511AQY1_9LACT|nr:GGDEF domain-containing protein [Alkalibacterium kapii]GEK90599.1 hypothetical protein AKA01nite_02210 [Alkalibacterium kapii]